MFKKLMNLFVLTIFCMGSFPLQAEIDIPEKMYINEDEFRIDEVGDAFHIHIGHNIWLSTNSIHRNKTGLFTYECNISRFTKNVGNEFESAYEKTWRCPYCYHYWPIGKPCQNKDCPSKYK